MSSKRRGLCFRGWGWDASCWGMKIPTGSTKWQEPSAPQGAAGGWRVEDTEHKCSCSFVQQVGDGTVTTAQRSGSDHCFSYI